MGLCQTQGHLWAALTDNTSVCERCGATAVGRPAPTMIQAELPQDDLLPWRINVVSILLNRTTATQVRKVLPTLWKLWPDPGAMATASRELEDVVMPLGLRNKRAFSLRMMSAQIKAGRDPRDGYGIGKYGRDCLQVFWRRNYNVEPTDGALRAYVEWARERDELQVQGGRQSSPADGHGEAADAS